MNVTQALISVSDKRGVLDFARELSALGIKLLSTGGTASLLREAGLPVTDVSEHTGFPEMLDGRVKTLHPKVHGGILARRDLAEHMDTIAAHDIGRIDLVVVNLYPFQQTVAKPDCTLEDAIENIDIGGPTMVRAAAKNHGNEQGGVGIVTDPEDYGCIVDELKTNAGKLSHKTRFALAVKAFTHTARYDSAISNYLTALVTNEAGDVSLQTYPERLQLAFDKVQDLRYGENPHQTAAFYRQPGAAEGGVAGYTQLQGKELSYNNIADADAAWECVKAFDGSAAACVIVKHANPCGVAVAASALEAYRKAFSTDPTSAFGGIIAFNGE
ncbi:MAG: bifunctional phosphoribosylaminoimidazolecarboxamide formyltransferase/IMP cyclohydrolase, partial [Thauera sp.]|nr:bifunctional phosphoribosylaminoimidazolecarboxamide formyltransferase/IMP cyclohydrolase [Thauera sp.]